MTIFAIYLNGKRISTAYAATQTIARSQYRLPVVAVAEGAL